jgi:hypothetical protein
MQNYKLTPEEELFLQFQNENGNEFVENSVKIQTTVQRIGWLFQMVSDGKIQSLSPYLQRILLTKVWRADNFLKSKSYIRDVWNGLGQTTPFFLVPIDLVLSNVEEFEAEEKKMRKNADVLAQIKEVKDKILEFKADKVELINLDGQTRSKESIVPYLKSEFNLLSDENQSVLNVLTENGGYEDISGKLFKDLLPIQKGFFYSVPLIINILVEGSLDDITNALISINSNEKWTDWQEIFHGTWVSVFPKRIHDVYEIDESGLVKDFFTNKVKDAGKYNADVSGWERWTAEQLYFLKNKTFPTISELAKVLKTNGIDIPNKEHSTKLREYILELSDNYTSDKMLNHQFVSDWCLFRDILDNGTTKNDHYYMNFNIQKLKVLSTSRLLTWFTKRIETLNSEYLLDENKKEYLNEKSYVNDGKGAVAKADSYPSHKKGGYKLVSMTGRMKILVNELNESFEWLAKELIISTTVSMPKKSSVLAANDYTSNAGVLIDPTKKSSDKYERGHVQSRKNEGEDVVSNLKPQVKKANRAYSGRNMITE